MKLKVDKGELLLPENFSFEIEHNSAFFSEDGASTVTTTIPASPDDLAKLEYPSRPARDNRFVNLFPVILSQGIFQKKGQLIVQSASKDGITCAIALEDSDFYSQFKEKELKEVFAAKVLRTYSTVAAWYNYLFSIYSGAVTGSPFRVIPVAVNYDESKGSYQVNNEPILPSSWSTDTIFQLQYAARLVPEGSDKINVPAGYGIAPFYLLYAFLEDMFSLCGYTVGNNCFRTNPDLNTLLLLHNCSDVICKSRIDCSDLVPSGQISDILEWLRNKFMAQIVVYPAKKMVDIVLLEDILTASFDIDLTGKLLNNLTQTFNQSSRIVITPDTSLEGSSPAAETLEELKNKYESVIEGGDVRMGLYQDLVTGDYYEVYADFATVRRVGGTEGRTGGSDGRSGTTTTASNRMKRIGSNYFTYDRGNSKESEEHTWEDLTPPMVFVNGVLMPYIGERKHRSTSYKGSEKDEEQDIIVVDYAGRSAVTTFSMSYTRGGVVVNITTNADKFSSHYFYGTTQKYDNAGILRTGRYNLNAPEMFERFFDKYNTLLRNNLVKLEGRFDIAPEDIFSWNLYRLKLYNGQLLLPVQLKYEVGRQMQCQQAAFYVVKEYSDGDADEPTVIPTSEYEWVLNDSLVEEAKAEVQEAWIDKTIYAGYDDAYSSGEDTFFLPAPTSTGQHSAIITRTVVFYYLEPDPHGERPTQVNVATRQCNVWFDSAAMS